MGRLLIEATHFETGSAIPLRVTRSSLLVLDVMVAVGLAVDLARLVVLVVRDLPDVLSHRVAIVFRLGKMRLRRNGVAVRIVVHAAVAVSTVAMAAVPMTTIVRVRECRDGQCAGRHTEKNELTHDWILHIVGPV